jgi:hypothetical protein
MKINPISILERSHIIRHLKVHGKWEGTRMGAHVRMFRFPLHDGKQRIEYAVGLGSQNITGQAVTAGAAIDDINALILGRPVENRRRKPEPPFVPRSGKAPEWFPYNDA